MRSAPTGRLVLRANYEVEHEFPHLGTRIMRLNACQVFYKEGAETTILLGIEDVTVRRKLEQEKDDLLQQKDVLLEEIQHRIANSLQIIAGIILMKANTVSSEETRPLLQDIHDRVISIAAVQRQLHASGTIGPIEMVAYLRRLSEALATSMIGDARPVTVRVVGDGGTLSSRQAESIGLKTGGLADAGAAPKHWQMATSAVLARGLVWLRLSALRFAASEDALSVVTRLGRDSDALRCASFLLPLPAAETPLNAAQNDARRGLQSRLQSRQEAQTRAG